MFELVRRIKNIDVFLKQITRAATDLVESRPFRRERIAFSERKISHIQSLNLLLEAMDNSNFGFYSIRPRKLNENPTYQSISGSAEPKSALSDALSTYCLAEFGNFLQHFPQKTLLELEKNASEIFQSRPRVKVELTRENGKKTSNTALKGYV